VTGLPKTVVITSEEVREAMSVPVEAIIATVRDTLDRTPPNWPRTSWSAGWFWWVAGLS
jgi:actin-like ATPase involved in cell morphogenesis